MATIQQQITEVRRIIHDEATPYRWSDAELIDYSNAGCRQTISLIPEANTIEAVVDTGTSRVARQELPAGGIKFQKIGRNYADDGTTPQGVVRYVEKDALDTYDPDWEYVTAAVDGDNYFEHYCHDKREPKVFYLFPPPVEDDKQFALIYSADIAAAITDVVDTFPLDDEYYNAQVMYVVYRALTKESRETLPDAFRQDLWQNYLTALGLGKRARVMVSPENPEVKAPEGD